jgi:hypothetical protein
MTSTHDNWTFADASAFWRDYQGTEADAATGDRYDSAEAYLLGHAPQNFAEADTIFTVLIDNGFDRRTDNLDITALRNLQAYMRRSQAA